jgi:predicted RNase H-like HicB family nuclease
MRDEIIFQVEEAPEGGYTAKAIGFSIFTEADTIEELKKMVKEAVLCHFEEGERPKLIRLHFVKEETILV